MNFNTQISTSVEQSRQLLALGIKKDTADMVWMAEMGYDAENFRTYDTEDYFLRPIDYLEGEEHRDNVPAWSLHRLIAMCPSCIDTHPRLHKTITDSSIFYCEENWEEEYEISFSEYPNLYDNIVACIGWLIEEGLFDEKYLEE